MAEMMTDPVLMAAEMIRLELESANKKFGPFSSLHEGIAVLREEYLELEHEVFHGTRDRAFCEALQVGAMAAKMLTLMMDDGHHTPAENDS